MGKLGERVKREKSVMMWSMHEDGRSIDDIAACFGISVNLVPARISLGARVKDVAPDWDANLPKLSTGGRELQNLSVTVHAHERWKERIPSNVNMLDEYRYAVAVTPKRKKMIAKNCPKQAAKYMGEQFAGRYFLESRRSNIIFVMQHPNIMITVFCL